MCLKLFIKHTFLLLHVASLISVAWRRSCQALTMLCTSFMVDAIPSAMLWQSVLLCDGSGEGNFAFETIFCSLFCIWYCKPFMCSFMLPVHSSFMPRYHKMSCTANFHATVPGDMLRGKQAHINDDRAGCVRAEADAVALAEAVRADERPSLPNTGNMLWRYTGYLEHPRKTTILVSVFTCQHAENAPYLELGPASLCLFATQRGSSTQHIAGPSITVPVCYTTWQQHYST